MSDSDHESDFESADEGDGGQSDNPTVEKDMQNEMDNPTNENKFQGGLEDDLEQSKTVTDHQQLVAGASNRASVVTALPPTEEEIAEELVNTKTGSSEAEIAAGQKPDSIPPLSHDGPGSSNRTGQRQHTDPILATEESKTDEDQCGVTDQGDRPDSCEEGCSVPGDTDLTQGDPAEIEESGSRSESSPDRDSPVRIEAATRKLEQRSSKIERSVFDKLNEAAENRQTQSSSWGSWGASLLSTATSSVTTFTSHVGQGLTSVIEGVEATLGAPSPEELAAHVRKIEKEREATEKLQLTESTKLPTGDSQSPCSQESTRPSQSGLPGSLGSFVSSVGTFTSAIEQAGSKALSGGLDTLEMIGRKTMDVLQEGDPGLKKKRSFLGSGKPNLSDVLKEVQEKAKLDNVQESQGEKQVHFGSVFDECQGLVHIEALEMLSKQCKQKVEVTQLSLEEEEVAGRQAQLLRFKEACVWDEVDDVDENSDHNFAAMVEDCSAGLHLSGSVNTDALIKTQQKERTWLTECQAEQEKGEQKDPQELHARAITCLATFTASAIKLIHKICEVTLLADDGDALQEISAFSKLMNVFCLEVAILSAKFSSCLNVAADDSEDPDACSPLITNVYLEASNSNTYIQDAFELVVPIFQLKFINQTCPETK